MSVTVKLHGMKEAVAALNQLEGRLKFKHLRIALNAAMSPVKRQAIANAPRGSGLLAKSMRVKVKIPDASYNPNHHGKPAYGLVGPGRGIVGFNTISKTGKVGGVSARTLAAATKATAAGKGLIQTVRERDRFSKLAVKPVKLYRRRASRYAHFVEKGRKGKGATYFMARAAQQAAPIAYAAFQSKIADGINKVAAELHAKQRAASVFSTVP